MTTAGAALLCCSTVIAAVQQAPERVLAEAMANVYTLKEFTAFDWVSAHYNRGTLTLEGFARTSGLKQKAEAVARKSSGVDEVVNTIALLPAIASDDDVRIRAYFAIYGSSALERYAPTGHLSDAALADIDDALRIGIDGANHGHGPHAIHIIVNGARVLLIGQVRTTGDRQQAEARVRTLSGVLGVVNQLTVPGRK
jgi:hypothetical protein